MKKLNISKVLIASLLMTAVPAAAQGGTVLADAGSCTTGQMCLSSGTAGTGNWYQFATNDGNLGNNSYTSGKKVSDNNRSVRNRNSSTTRVCVYVDHNYTGGTTGYGNYANATWVTLQSSDGSSIRFRSSASC